MERELRESLLQQGAGRKELAPSFDEFFAEFMTTYVAANNKQSELASKRWIYEVHLRPCFGSIRLDEIGLRQVEGFKARLRTHKKLRVKDGRLSAKMVNNILTVLGRVLGYAVELGIIPHVPRVKFVKVQQRKFDFLDFDELGRLVVAARTEPDLQVAIMVAAEGGLRAGEVRALTWANVSTKARQLSVTQADWRGHIDTPKGGRVRTLDMTERVYRALSEIRHLRGQFVFCDADGARWDRTEMDAALWRVCRRAGLREIGWHTLRHTFCSHLAMLGVPAQQIQKLAGHSSLSITERYMHLSPASTANAIRALDSRDLHGTLTAQNSAAIEIRSDSA